MKILITVVIKNNSNNSNASV